jgi:hypothetical protein
MPKLLKAFSQMIFISLLITSCASGYHVISPSTLNFPSVSGDSSIVVEYQTNLLSGKYAKREIKSDVYLIAVKITNNSGQDIIFRNNIKIFSNEEEVTPIPLNTFYTATQQNPDKSLTFLFLAPLNVYTFSQTTNGGEVTSKKNRFYPIGIILGPALGLGNMAAAKGANRKFKKELDENDILERIILRGETVYGLIAVKDFASPNLTFKRNF